MNDTTSGFVSEDELLREIARLRDLLSKAGIDSTETPDEIERSTVQSEEREKRRTETFVRVIRSARANLAASRADLALYRAILESATDFAIIATDRTGVITKWNEGAALIFGWDEDEMIGHHLECIFTAADRGRDIIEREMRQALDDGRAGDERWHIRQDGTRFWANGLMMPLYLDDEDEEDEDSETHLGFLKVLRDESEQHRVRESLRESHERLNSALATGLIGFFEWEIANDRVSGDERFASFFQIPMDEAKAGVALTDLVDHIHPEDRDTFSDNVKATRESTADYVREYRVTCNADTIWVLERGHCYEESDTGPIRYSGVIIDITEQKRLEENRRMLSRELQHRIKNMLAVIQSIANQSFRNSDPQAAASFFERLTALAGAHDVLTQTSWQDAPISDVISNALKPHGSDRFKVDGPEYQLTAKQALALALGLHELATNAAKYGALSVPDGHVEIRWTRSRGLTLTWSEHDGPDVSEPTRKGFGSRLIERSLAAEFEATVTNDYRPDGLVCTIDASNNPA